MTGRHTAESITRRPIAWHGPDMEGLIRPWDLTDEAVQQVRDWLAAARDYPVDRAAQQLAGVLSDPDGLDFTVGFVDRVIRTEDPAAAAKALNEIAAKVPAFLPWYLQSAVKAGGTLGKLAPRVVIPAARAALRNMVSHLIVDARPDKLTKAIKELRTEGIDLNINLLGEAILGEDQAAHRVKGTKELIERSDVDYVSIKVSATVAPHSPWAFDEAVTDIVEHLRPLYRAANNSSPRTFINLDMEEYKDLDLTLAVFTELLSEDEFTNTEAGIVLQAYLPDSYAAMKRLQRFAAERVANGGAPIKVRLVKGANLPMEQVEAQMRGWTQTVWSTKQLTDANYKAILDYALTQDHVKNVRLGIAGHNLFDIALHLHLMRARGIEPGGKDVEFEMLLGMASQQAQAVRQDVGRLLLYTPVVKPDEFDVAISYLVRRLEEGATEDNFMSEVFNLDEEPAAFKQEEERFRESVSILSEWTEAPVPRRFQDRNKEDFTQPTWGGTFTNEPDTDPDLAWNRLWGGDILKNIPTSTLGTDTVAAAKVKDTTRLNEVYDAAQKAADVWQGLTPDQRADVLHRAGDKMKARRADLLEVMGSEAGKTLAQGDPEVSEAIDFCNYYAEQARNLGTIAGAEPVMDKVTLVTPPWNFPVAIPTGSTISALAAGSAVVIKPARASIRCGAVLTECIWEALDEAGLPREILQLIDASSRDLGDAMITDERVGRVILTGAYETAQAFHEMRPGLPLFAETSGKNAIIVTPSADYDLAAKDIVDSAFGHAGQKCSAASLVILVGQAARSERLYRQIVDAANSLVVGYPENPESIMGPVIEEPGEKLRRGLTQLEPGQNWVLKPEPLDDSGKLFSPGIRAGVKPGSEFHLTEYFGPVTGIMHAESLEEAVQWVNQIDYGLTSGIHSLDAEEIRYWQQHIEAGNLYINRGITGAIVQRQPFGGWKKSAVGTGTKAGGPNYVPSMLRWEDSEHGLGPADREVIVSTPHYSMLVHTFNEEPRAWLEQALAQDAKDSEFFEGLQDATGLDVEVNGLRYRPVKVRIRVATIEEADLVLLARVVAAGWRVLRSVTDRVGTGAKQRMEVSLPDEAPIGIADAYRQLGAAVVIEDEEAWLETCRQLSANPDGSRVRLIGREGTEEMDALVQATREATTQAPDLAVNAHPVTRSGRIEMLPFVREQSVTMTAHRYGTVNKLASEALGDVTRK